VARLEALRTAPKSPFDVEAFAADSAGLDPIDFPLVVEALRRWERDGVWQSWHRQSNRVWQQGKAMREA
jgi:hypothetical protein